MQITMHIVAEWLGRFDPEPKITTNRRQLQNVRLFSEGLQFSPSTLYLSAMDGDRIICTNENDIFVVRSDDINEVFNTILDAFEYYNGIENRAYRMIEQGCAEREILELLAELTKNFLIMADTGFYMRETAGPETLIRNHNGLVEIIGQRMLPYDALEEISAQPFIRRQDVPPYLTEVPNLGTACVTNLFTAAEHAGWLIACGPDGEFSEAEKDRIDCAGRIAEYWLSRNKNIRNFSKKAGIILDLLSGQEKNNKKTPERLRTFGWMETDEKQVFVLKEKGAAQISQDALIRKMELQFPGAFAVLFGEEPVLLVNYAISGHEEVACKLTELLKGCRCIAGESSIFKNIFELKGHVRTARLVAELMTAGPGNIGSFGDIRLSYVLRTLNEHAVSEVKHPAVEILKEYDRVHEGDFLRTLEVFLDENCSYTAAARSLFIHRSTLIYRMERIGEMTGIDLSDPEERFLLRLSCYFIEVR